MLVTTRGQRVNKLMQVLGSFNDPACLNKLCIFRAYSVPHTQSEAF